MPVHDVYGPWGAPRDILDQAHHETLALAGLDHHGRNLRLTQHLEGFQPAFATDEIVSRPPGAITAAHRDRTLQADGLNVVHDLPVLTLVARAWIQNGDPGDRDHFDPVRTDGRHHAASPRGMGVAMS